MSTGQAEEVQISTSRELRENLLDATACLYKLEMEKACHRWSFMLKRDGTATSLSEFKNYLAINHGLNEVAKTFGIQNLLQRNILLYNEN